MAKQPTLTPEMLVPRLGEHLIKQNMISKKDLQKALTYQEEKKIIKQPILLGQALLELEMIDRPVLDEAITELIIQLRSALEAANRNLERRVQERTSELTRAIEKLSELSQMKANFISNVSHELRTPLTVINGYVGLLASGSLGELTEEQNQALLTSQKSAARLEEMIDELIMFSQTSGGELNIDLEPVNLLELAESAVKLAADKAKARGVTIHTEIDDDLPPVQVDLQKIGWVLNQLLDNGIKFTPAEGRIDIKLEIEERSLVMVSISDTGIGIPTSRIEEIFEPFHQLDPSSKRRYGGAGLGLALVRQIVEAHGSILDVKSVEGRGTSFRFPLLAVEPE